METRNISAAAAFPGLMPFPAAGWLPTTPPPVRGNLAFAGRLAKHCYGESGRSSQRLDLAVQLSSRADSRRAGDCPVLARTWPPVIVASMPPGIFPVVGDRGERLAVVGRPRAGHWLADDLAAFRAAGIDVLVSALHADEVRATWLEREGALAVAAGLRFVRLPLPNMLPPDREAVLPGLRELAADVRDGAHLAVHCFASVGRAPLIVAAVLVLLGHEPDDAWRRIALARGREVPDTHAQREWVAALRLYSGA